MDSSAIEDAMPMSLRFMFNTPSLYIFDQLRFLFAPVRTEMPRAEGLESLIKF